MGLANDQPMSPFMPYGLSEDSVFGAMVGFADSSVLFGHIPYGVIHDSTRPSDYAPGELMPSARQTRISEFLLAVIYFENQSAWSAVTSRRRRLEDILFELAQLSVPEFSSVVGELTVQARRYELAQIESFLASRLDTYPDYFLAACDRYHQTLRRCMAQPEFFLPIEFRGASSISKGFQNAQTFIRGFGDLIRWWPAIWKVAADHNRSH
jgi:hypothetical protein